MGIQVEESSAAAAEPADVSLDEPDFVEFARSGSALAGEIRCVECGYGAVVHRVVPLCPMCGGSLWGRRGAFSPGRAA